MHCTFADLGSNKVSSSSSSSSDRNGSIPSSGTLRAVSSSFSAPSTSFTLNIFSQYCCSHLPRMLSLSVRALYVSSFDDTKCWVEGLYFRISSYILRLSFFLIHNSIFSNFFSIYFFSFHLFTHSYSHLALFFVTLVIVVPLFLVLFHLIPPSPQSYSVFLCLSVVISVLFSWGHVFQLFLECYFVMSICLISVTSSSCCFSSASVWSTYKQCCTTYMLYAYMLYAYDTAMYSTAIISQYYVFSLRSSQFYGNISSVCEQFVI